MSRPASRPYDPTARSALNLIVAEVRPLVERADYIFVPSHGPFYTENAVLRSKGLLLKRGVDYEYRALHMDATEATGKEVACIIHITNRNLFEVSIDYQVVGHPYHETYSVLKWLIENLGEPIVEEILWDQIAEKPLKFNSSSHMHPFWELDGWEGVHTPLNKILQGVYFRKQEKIRKTYDYYYAKQTAFEAYRDNGISQILKQIETLQLTNVDPLRIVKIVTDTIPPDPITQGKWETTTTLNNDRVLGGAGSTTALGKTVNLSKDIVYPQPDNIILDEQENPILRDDEEWIYQDNQFPVVPLPGDLIDEDGIEFTAQEWDLFYYKSYHKLAHAGALFATITADRTAVSDGQTVTFKLSSARYQIGLQVPYQITGVAQANINKPLTGVMTIGADGSASLPVQLIAGSPATWVDWMRCELALAGGISVTVGVDLSTNKVKKFKGTFTTGVNDIVKTVALPYEPLHLMIDSTGRLPGDPDVATIQFLFDDGVQHPITLNYNQQVTTNGFTSVNLNGEQNWYHFVINPTVAFNSKRLTVNIRYKDVNVASTSIKLEDIRATVYAVDGSSNKPVSEVIDDDAFIFVAETNTTGNLIPTIVENTIGSELTPELGGAVPIFNGRAETPNMTASRRIRRRDDFVTVEFSLPNGRVIGRYRLKIKINMG